MSKTWKNLKLQDFQENPNKWYNLSTRRYVKKQPKEAIGWSIQGIRILGTLEQVNQFWEINLKQIQKEFAYQDKCLFKPFEDISFICYDVSSRSEGQEGKIYFKPPRSNDVENLSEEQFDSLTKFNLGGLFLKTKVFKVIDGDTLNVAAYIPLKDLSRPRSLYQNKSSLSVYCPGKQDNGFFMSFSIRVYGYDSVEKDQPAGKMAKKLMEEKIKSLNNIIWCQMVEINIAVDKYGRHLAILYEDPKKKKLLNTYLLEQESKVNQKLVHPYLGGTKKRFS